MRNPDLFFRACSAYLRHCKPPAIAQQPSAGDSGTEEVNGESVFVLRNVNGPLAAYIIKPTGRMGKRMDLKYLVDSSVSPNHSNPRAKNPGLVQPVDPLVALDLNMQAENAIATDEASSDALSDNVARVVALFDKVVKSMEDLPENIVIVGLLPEFVASKIPGVHDMVLAGEILDQAIRQLGLAEILRDGRLLEEVDDPEAGRTGMYIWDPRVFYTV